MTDTPPVVSVPPPSHAEQLKSFLGDLARPFAIYVIAAATGWAIVNRSPPDLVGAAGLILAALYGAKAAESAITARANAGTATAAAQANGGITA